MRDMISEGDQTFSFPICNNCKHFISGKKCTAFDEIPIEILSGLEGHSKPIKAQKNNIVFEPISK